MPATLRDYLTPLERQIVDLQRQIDDLKVSIDLLTAVTSTIPSQQGAIDNGQARKTAGMGGYGGKRGVERKK